MPDFHVFYLRQRTGDMIDSYDPKPMKLAHIVDLASNVLEGTGDFLGLVDDDEGLLQMMYLARHEGDERPIRLEIPDIAHCGCHTKQVSPTEMPEVLRRLPGKLSRDAVPGLRFERCSGC